MKGLYYFNHDDNANSDIKLQKLMFKIGLKGYGLFWLICEKMHQENGYIADDDIEMIAWLSRTTKEEISPIIEEMFSLGLLKKTDDGKIYSQRMINDIQEVKTKSDSGKKGMANRYNKQPNTSDNKTDNTSDNTSDNKQANKQPNKQPNTSDNTSDNKQANKKITKDKIRKDKKTTTTTEKNSDAVVDVSSPQSESVTDCNGLQNMSDEQIAGAIALLDSLGVDSAPSPVEVSAEDVSSILIDDDAAFNPNDDVIDFDTQQQQETDNAAAALIDDKSKMRDTLTKTYAITESLADIMLSKHDVTYIQGKIDLLSKQKNIDNPGAWLIKACREDYQVAAVTQEKPPTQSTRVYSDDLYDQFCQHFKRVFNQDFTHKALYENAVNLLGSESKVDFLLTVINDYKGNVRIKEILNVNHCHGFSEVMKSESAMTELIGFGTAQNRKDMAEKIKELPWMQQDKQGA